MRHVVIKTVDESPGVAFPALDGVKPLGAIKTRSVIGGADRPLLLWVHEMAPGSSIALAAPKVGHAAYVWKGGIEANGKALGTESVVVVEHGGNCTITADAGGATLAHYHQSEALPNMTAKAGGHVHFVGADGLHRRDDPSRHTVSTVWADAHCPTCDLWLHKSAFGVSRPQGEPHMHNVDEIIFVVSGRVVVGRIHAPGTAVAVDTDTIYGFGVDEGGASFINFRPRDPSVRMTAKGKPLTDWMSEYDYMVNGGISPAILHLAATPAS